MITSEKGKRYNNDMFMYLIHNKELDELLSGTCEGIMYCVEKGIKEKSTKHKQMLDIKTSLYILMRFLEEEKIIKVMGNNKEDVKEMAQEVFKDFLIKKKK